MASAGEVLQLFKDLLSVEECEEKYRATLRPLIASCINSAERNQRIALLKEYFKVEVRSEKDSYPGEYDGGAIVLELVEQALAYAVKRGLPCHEICFFLSFYVSCLDLIASSGGNEEVPSMVRTIQQLQDTIVPLYCKYLSASSLQLSMEFVTQSIFQHFHLYQFLLTQPQTTVLTSLELAVETPAMSPLSLQEAVTEEAWLKTKKTEELEIEYDKRIKQLEATEAEARSLADANLVEVYKTQLADFAGGPKKVSEEQLSSIVDALLKAHMERSVVTVSQSLLRQSVDLSFRLEQLEVLPAIQATQHKEVGSNAAASLRSSIDINAFRNPSRASAAGFLKTESDNHDVTVNLL